MGRGSVIEDKWSQLSRPWTIEQCRDRYVMGMRISLRALSKVSGVSAETISKASSRDRWTDQRAEFRATVNIKTFDIVSAQIAGKTAEILTAHYERELDLFNYISRAAKLADKYTDQGITRLEEFEELKSELGGEELDKEEELNAYNPYRLQALMASLNLAQTALSSAIDGQRKALGLDYADINYAVSSVRRAGLEVVEKHEFELFKQYLVAQASTQNTETSDTAAVEVSTLEVVAPCESTSSPAVE
jgi:hypothetical protein